jgi:plasmid stability protein
MAILVIRIDEKIKRRLKIRAAQHGCSIEEEAAEILRSALQSSPTIEQNLAEAIRQRFAPYGGVDLELPPRDPVRQLPDFTE